MAGGYPGRGSCSAKRPLPLAKHAHHRDRDGAHAAPCRAYGAAFFAGS